MQDSYGDPRKAKIEFYLATLVLAALIIIFNIHPTLQLYQEPGSSHARLASLLTTLVSLSLIPSHLFAGHLVTRKKFGKYVPRVATIQIFLLYGFLLWARTHIL